MRGDCDVGWTYDALAMTYVCGADRRQERGGAGEIGVYYYVYIVRCSVGGPLRFVLH